MKKLFSLFFALMLFGYSFTQLDVGAVTVITPSSPMCPTNPSSIVVRIKNYAVATIDFSVNNVTVAVNITGASTQSFSTVVNSGTLAFNDVLDVTVTAAANFSVVGTHNLAFSATVVGDVNLANDGGTEAKVVRIPTLTLSSAVGTDAQTVCINAPITNITYAVGGGATGASITAGALPAGVTGTYAAGVFTISGTPTTAVGSPFSYTVTTSGGCTPAVSLSGTITVTPAPTLTLTSAVGTDAQTVCVNTAITNITYATGSGATSASITAGALPAGVTGSFAAGVFTISGTPTTSVGSPFSYTVTTSGGCTPAASLSGTITVSAASTISLSSAVGTDAQTVCVNTAITNITYAVGGSATSASITAGALPAGVTGTFAAGVFTISGTPTTAVGSPFSYTVTTSGGCAPNVSLSGTITVSGASTISLSSAVGTDAQTVCINTAITNITYAIGGSATGASITAGALPAGVTGSFAAGVFTISGTPTTAVGSPFSYTVTTSGGCAPAASLSGTITVSGASTISLSSAVGTDAQSVCVNSAITNITYAIGGSATGASITAGALPAGVTGSFAAGVFTISGTPTTTVGSPFSYTVTTSGGCAPNVSLSGTITVIAGPSLTLTSAVGTNAQTVCVNTAITNITYAVGGTATSASITAGALPAGVTGSFAAGVFTISGTPTTSVGSPFSYTVTTSGGACSPQVSLSGTITVTGASTISLSSAVGTDGQTVCVNTAITNITYAVGGSATSASITAGALPAGVTGSFAAGVFTISGTPTTSVGSPFSYTVTTSGGCAPNVSLSGTITVTPAPTLTLTSAVGTNAQTVCINTAITNITYAIGGSATSASITAGALPAGVTGSFAAGVFTITGTPTTAVGSPFSYTVTTSGGCTPAASLSGTITVSEASTLFLTSAVGTTAQTVCVNTAITNITYAIAGSSTSASITAGALPAGVTGSFAAGVFTISGTPTTSVGSPFSYTVTASGGCAPFSSLSGTITVTGASTISLSSAVGTDGQTVCSNTAITNITYAVGGSATSASITAGTLPAGVTGSFAAGVFTISGTPTTSVGSPFSYTVTTSGGCAPNVSLSGTITVTAGPSLTLTSAVGTASQTVCVNSAITNITYAVGGSATSASITAGALPAGVTGSFAAGVFTISGTPTTTVGSPFSYTVTTSGGACAPQVSLSGTITVNALPTFALSGSNPTVCGASDGSITISGLTASTSYIIAYNDDAVPVSLGTVVSTAGGTYVISALNAGSYTNFSVTLVSSGCAGTNIAGVSLTNPGAPDVFDIADQTSCVVGYTLPVITGTGLSGSQGYYSGINGTGINYPVGTVIGTSGTVVYIYDIVGLCSDQENFLVTIDATPTITLTSAVGTDAQTVCVNSAITNITYAIGGSATSASITAGALPAGVSGSFAAGVFTISGTPTTAVGSPFSYTVTTSGGSCAPVSISGTITVIPASTLALTSAVGTDAQTVCINTAITSISYTIGGSATGASITAGALPTGVTGSFVAGVFTISGTPTTAVGSPFSYTVTTSGGCIPASLSGTITVSGLPSISLTSGVGTDAQTICVNVPITSISYTIGGSATSASITAGALPAGVTGSFAAGVFTISGTPTTSVGSPFSYTVTTSGGLCGPHVSISGTITVTAGPTLTMTSAVGTNAQTVCSNTAITNITYAIGGSATGASITAGALPAGVTGSFAAGVFTISGTPTTSVGSPFSYTVTTSGGCAPAASLSGTITVGAAPTYSITGSNPTICGAADGSITISGLTPSTSYDITYSDDAVVTVLGTVLSSVGGTYLISGLNAGSYTNFIVALTASGCPTVNAAGVSLLNPGAPIVNDIADQVLCNVGYTLPVITGTSLSGSEGYWSGINGTGVNYPVGTVIAVSGTTVYIYDAVGACSSQENFLVTIDALPTITLTSAVGTNAQTVCVNSAITNITYAIGGSATSASITAGALPSGVTGTFAAGVFTISGTPTTTVGSPFSYTVTTSGGACAGVSLSGTITVDAVPTLTLTSAVGTSAQTVCVNSAITNITYAVGGSATSASITAGALPAGVTGTFAAGVFTISGTPTTAVGSPFSYTVTTSGGTCAPVSVSGTITVDVAPTLTLTSAIGTNIQTVCVNTAITSISYTIGGSATGASITAGSLPTGVAGSFVAGVFTISGTPTTAVGSPFSYTVTTSGGVCTGASLSGTITVDTPPTIALTSAVGTDAQTVCENTALTNINYTIGGGATSASITAGALPAGVTGAFAAGVFTISGTPTTAVGSPFSYTVTTSGGTCVPVVSVSGTITVDIAPTIVLTSAVGTTSQTVCENTAITNIDYTIGGGATSASITAGSLPAGVTGTFAAGVFTISGTPTTAVGSPFSYTVTTSGGVCTGASLSGTITVDTPHTIALTSAVGTAAQTVCENTAISNIDYTIGGGATSASITAGSLPAGVTGTFAAGIFTISGTPTTAVGSPFSYTVTTSGGTCAAVSIIGTIDVTIAPTLTLTSAAGTDTQVICLNSPIVDIDYTIGGGAIGASITVGSLPTGVTGTFAAGVFTISGTPTSAVGNPFSFTVSTSGGGCAQVTLSGTMDVISQTITLTSAAFTNSQSICLGNAITNIDYTVGGGSTGASITSGVLPAGVAGTFAAGVFTISGTPTETGTFFFNVTSTGACGGATEIGSITINPILSGNTAGSDVTICEGTSTSLTGGPIAGGDGTYTYLWESSATPGGPYSPATGVNNGSNYTTGNLLIDTYFIRTVTSGGCSDVSAEVAVTIDPLPTASAGGSVTICSNESVTVPGAAATNGTILWTHDGTGVLTNATTLTPLYTSAVGDAGNTVTLAMTVTGTNTCGTATATAIYTVNVNPLPTASAGGTATICTNDSVTVSGASATNGTILWTHDGAGTLSNATTLTPTYTPVLADAGTTVTLTMTVSSTVPCAPPIAPIAIFTVIVNALPGAPVNAGVDDTVSLGSSINLNTTGGSIVTWDWTPPLTLDNPFIYNPEATPDSTTTYVVTATHLNGCTSTDSVTIFVENDFTLIITNALTPNGDGKNDTWNIENIENYPNTEVIVINREGQIVFEDLDYANNWDGKFNGKYLPDATYYYIVKFAGSSKVYKGAVTILRGK